MIKAIIFDFFGVIRDDGYNRWLHKQGATLDGAYLEASGKHDRGDYAYSDFVDELGRLSGRTAEQIEYEMEHGNELNIALVEYIRQLGEHYKIALLSNSTSTYLRNELAKYQLESLFDEIIISSEAGLIKPEPAVFELMIKQLGVKADECVFTDDNSRNISAAVALGVSGIVFGSTAQFRKDLELLLASQ